MAFKVEFQVKKIKIMKNLRLFLSGLLLIVFNLSTSAQHNHGGMSSGSNSNMNMNMNSNMPMLPPKTETLKVWGKCDMCKARIEKIALASGASTADWNVKTKVLTVVYDPSKSTINYISDKLAKAGHDTGLRSAKDKAYNKLPDCCKYERIR
jgi:mercuric ion binding protein